MNPGSRTKFANLPDFAMQWLVHSLARPLCRKSSAIFVVSILEDFAGDFPGGFFWALFPTKLKRENPATKSAKKKSGGSKIKICEEKSVLPKTGPNALEKIVAILSPASEDRDRNHRRIASFGALSPLASPQPLLGRGWDPRLGPLVYRYPRNIPNSDHGLSFPLVAQALYPPPLSRYRV